MKKPSAICILLLVSLQARADMLITELVEAGGQTQNMTLKIKGGKVRTDVGSQMSTITDTASGDVTTIIHAQKTYMKISADKTKALMEKMQMLPENAAPGASPVEKPKIVDTGKKEKVNDYDTEIYTAENPTMKFTYWITKNFPNAAVVQQQMKKLEDSMQAKIGTAGNLTPDMALMPGLPVKTQMIVNGQTVTTTLISAIEAPVGDVEFTLPADYKEMQMPGFNQTPGAPAP